MGLLTDIESAISDADYNVGLLDELKHSPTSVAGYSMDQVSDDTWSFKNIWQCPNVLNELNKQLSTKYIEVLIQINIRFINTREVGFGLGIKDRVHVELNIFLKDEYSEQCCIYTYWNTYPGRPNVSLFAENIFSIVFHNKVVKIFKDYDSFYEMANEYIQEELYSGFTN
jgi:hypothetical protein